MGRSFGLALADARGASGVEYVISLVLVALLALGAWQLLGDGVGLQVDCAARAIGSLGGAPCTGAGDADAATAARHEVTRAATLALTSGDDVAPTPSTAAATVGSAESGTGTLGDAPPDFDPGVPVEPLVTVEDWETALVLAAPDAVVSSPLGTRYLGVIDDIEIVVDVDSDGHVRWTHEAFTGEAQSIRCNMGRGDKSECFAAATAPFQQMGGVVVGAGQSIWGLGVWAWNTMNDWSPVISPHDAPANWRRVLRDPHVIWEGTVNAYHGGIAAIKEDWHTLLHGSAYERGKVVGQFLHDVVMGVFTGGASVAVIRGSRFSGWLRRLRRGDRGPGRVTGRAAAPSQPAYTQLGLAYVDELAGKSVTLTRMLDEVHADGWKIELGEAGKGSWASRTQRRIVLDPRMDADQLVRAITHEAGHARYRYEKPSLGTSRADYVARELEARLKNEGEAILREFEIRDEILRNGGPRLPAGYGSKFEEAYRRYLQHRDRDRARADIADLVGDLTPTKYPGTTYRDVYGGEAGREFDWFQQHGSDPTIQLSP